MQYEPSGSIKCWETMKWLHNWLPLELCSALQCYKVSGLLEFLEAVHEFVTIYVQLSQLFSLLMMLTRECKFTYDTFSDTLVVISKFFLSYSEF
jgi:hypothetical protein